MPAASDTRSVRLHLDERTAEALKARARRNDRLAYLEAQRIIRDTLTRDGDLDETQDAPGQDARR